MDTIFKDTAHDPQELAARSAVYGLSYSGMLMESENPAKDVIDFCQTFRVSCSAHGKNASQKLSSGSRDYLKVVDWLKSMTMWLNTAEAAAKNLAISPRSPNDIKAAAESMGLLFAFHQSLEVVLD